MKKRFSLVTAFVLGTVLSSLLWSPGLQAQVVENPCAAPSAEPQPTVELPSQEEGPTAPADQVEPQDAVASPSPALQLSELLPDPEGADEAGEFIEIENVGDGAADTNGWSLESASGKKFALSANVAARGRYAFTYAETRLTLPNAGITITLRDPSGAVVDGVTYPGPAKTGKSYARDDSGAWRWTSIATQGSENAFDPVMAPASPPLPIVTPAAPEAAEEPTSPAPIETEAAPIDVASVADSLRISEFLPNPAGNDDDEWVELQNVGDRDIRLDGLFLDDAEGGSVAFSLAAIHVAANGHSVIPKSISAIALNNAGDAVRIVNAAGDVIASVRYEIAPEGRSYAFIDGAWAWTDAQTPGHANIAPVTATTESAPTAPKPFDGTVAEEPAEEASVGDVPDTDGGVMVAVSGIVTLAPGVIGKRTFAIQDGDAAMLIRAYGSAAMPAMSAGDVVRVTGRSRGGNPFSTTGRMIARIGRGEVMFTDRSLDELAADESGLAVRLRGTVTRSMSSGFVIADQDFGSETAVRTVRKFSADELPTGADVIVRGVVRSRAGKVELVTATIESVRPPSPAEDEILPPITPKNERAVFAAPAPEPRTSVRVAAGAAGSSVAAAALIALLRRRKEAAPEGLPADG